MTTATANGTEATNMATKAKSKGPATTVSEMDIKLMIQQGRTALEMVNAGADPVKVMVLLEEDNKRLKEAQLKKGAKVTSIKLSDKGGVSVYGLGRFPVTLYDTGWIALGASMPEILTFVQANLEEMKRRQAHAKTEEGKLAIATKAAEYAKKQQG